jgi:hypothetical protein
MSREEKAANKLADIFADERLNVVQLAYHTNATFTQTMFERLLGFIHWHKHINEMVQIRDDGGTDFIDGDYLNYIKRGK